MGQAGEDHATVLRKAANANPVRPHDGERSLEAFTFTLNELQDTTRQLRSQRRRVTDVNHSTRRMRGRKHKAAEIPVFGKENSGVRTGQFDHALVHGSRRMLAYCHDIKRRRAKPAYHREVTAFVCEKSQHGRVTGSRSMP